jgi:NADPH:quinone reductase-like Zn-dependent oxidoreductase
MDAIELTARGDPAQFLTHVDKAEPPAPLAGEVLLQVEYAPLNPSDLLMAQGTYPIAPELPTVIGGEGVGTVAALGAGVTNVRIGDTVLLPFGTFAWAERVIAPADDFIVLPAGIDLQQASMLAINPPTGALLLSEYVDLVPGDWIVQNAGNSGVGRSVIAFAKARGLRTLSVVRRPELIAELQAAGADAVIVSSPTAAAQASAATDGQPPRLALDGVSGRATALLGDIAGSDAVIVSYANMTGEPLTLHTGDLIIKRLTVKSFFLYYPDNLPRLREPTRHAADLMTAGDLTFPVAAVYPAKRIQDALARHAQGGKVLLDLNPHRA